MMFVELGEHTERTEVDCYYLENEWVETDLECSVSERGDFEYSAHGGVKLTNLCQD